MGHLRWTLDTLQQHENSGLAQNRGLNMTSLSSAMERFIFLSFFSPSGVTLDTLMSGIERNAVNMFN